MAEERLDGVGRRGGDAAPRPAGPPPSDLRLDLQSVLAACVEQLRLATGAESVAAWALRADGSPYLAAASYVGDPPVSPDSTAFAALAALPGATDLRRREGDPAHRALARRLRCAVAAPLSAGDGPPLAALLLEAPASLRPRAVAALRAAARLLEGPLSAALSLARLRRVESETRVADRLAALGGLAAEIAHEIRNPLVSVKTFLQLLPERRDDPEFQSQFLEVASEELQRVERLLDALIAQARPPAAAESEAGSVAQALASVEQLARVHALKRGVGVELEVPPDLPPVAISGDALRQVLLNLALNAIDASAPGGAVRLGAAARPGAVELWVRDAGPGVPPERRAAVFEPFVSAREGRPSGLGLAIARRIVEETGGSIEISDAEGGGAELRVRLPEGVALRRPGSDSPPD